MKTLPAFLTLISTLLLALATARAETTLCTNITSLPATISVPGVYCLKQDLATSSPSGNAITVNANNVIIDLNSFKLGGLGAGVNTMANGIAAIGRQNVTIRNGTIRGFRVNIYFDGDGGSGHLVEDIRSESARSIGINMDAADSIVRNNFVIQTGGGVGIDAFGIAAASGRGLSVIDNIVSGVTETRDVAGVYGTEAIGIVIQGNQIRDLVGNAMYGIFVNSSQSLVQNNIISNTTVTGTQGIDLDEASLACFDNMVGGYASLAMDCSAAKGNRTF